MASINGVSVKKLKQFDSWEGPCLQGEVYVGRDKAYCWSQDPHGGPDSFYKESDYDGARIEDLAKAYYEVHKPVDTLAIYDMIKDGKKIPDELPRKVPEFEVESHLMYDLCCLIEVENVYKKAVKDRFKMVAVYATNDPRNSSSASMLPCNTRKEAEEFFKNKMKKDHLGYLTFYEKLSDFVKEV